jgi:DNA-binding transcriptional LysR family regulator
MDLNKLLYFQAVASTGNISKATKIVGLSQPALTIQIQGLEYDLGFKLFERHNRGLILTEEGKTLLERTRLLDDWQRETVDIISELNEPVGTINLGTYTTASSYLLAERLLEFFNTYPQLKIRYHYPSTDKIIEQIKSLELDCAIMSETPNDPLLEIIPFFKSELVYVTSTKNTGIKQLKPAELSNHPFLSYPIRMDYCYREVERKYGKYLKKAPIPIESESFDTLKNSLIAGIGNSFMPKYIIQKELDQKLVKIVDIGGAKLPVTFSFITRKDRKLPKRIEAFKTHMLS